MILQDLSLQTYLSHPWAIAWECQCIGPALHLACFHMMCSYLRWIQVSSCLHNNGPSRKMLAAGEKPNIGNLALIGLLMCWFMQSPHGMRCICSYFGGPSVHQTVRLATINTRPDQLLLFWRRCKVGFGDPRNPLIARAVPQL